VQFSSLGVMNYADLSLEMMSRGTSIAAVAQRLSMSAGVGIAAQNHGWLQQRFAEHHHDDHRDGEVNDIAAEDELSETLEHTYSRL